jgi:hypothetical protein
MQLRVPKVNQFIEITLLCSVGQVEELKHLQTATSVFILGCY